MYLWIIIASFIDAECTNNAKEIADSLEENAENLINASALLKQIKPLLNQENDTIQFNLSESDSEIKIKIFTEDVSQMKSILKLNSIHDLVKFSLMDGHYHFIDVDEFLNQ